MTPVKCENEIQYTRWETDIMVFGNGGTFLDFNNHTVLNEKHFKSYKKVHVGQECF